MFKTALITAALILGSVGAKADSGVYDVLNDSITINIISISSAVVGGQRQLFLGELTGAATGFPMLMENRKYMEIQNIHVSTGVFCVIGLSSTSASGDLGELAAPGSLSTTQGRYIAPYGSWLIPLTSRDMAARVFLPYCVNNGATGATKVALIQARSK